MDLGNQGEKVREGQQTVWNSSTQNLVDAFCQAANKRISNAVNKYCMRE